MLGSFEDFGFFWGEGGGVGGGGGGGEIKPLKEGEKCRYNAYK